MEFQRAPPPPSPSPPPPPPTPMPQHMRPLLRSISAPSPPTAASPVILGRYRIGRFLGKGSFAKVHEAHSLNDHHHGGAPVAVKIIDKKSESFQNSAMEGLILGEIEAMRRLKHHPNILRIHEVMATKTKIYLVVELASGGELLKKIASRPNFLLDESEARRLFGQLVSALRHCHVNGVAHRDVKPQNLLLDARGNLKVSDFGLSALPERADPSDGMLKTACGTPAFTAPEILCRRRGAARGYDGAKADAWSCGVILHVLLAGKLPFGGDSNLPEMLRRIKSRDVGYPEGISRAAKRLIHRLLDPNPESRLGLEELSESAWMRRYRQPEPPELMFYSGGGGGLEKHEPLYGAGGARVGAFDIISMSSGLNLAGLFEAAGSRRREARFVAAKMTAEAAVERVREVGEGVGFRAETGKSGRRLGLAGKGRAAAAVVIEAAEISEGFVVGEVKMVQDGGDRTSGESHWETIKYAVAGMSGFTWINDTV